MAPAGFVGRGGPTCEHLRGGRDFGRRGPDHDRLQTGPRAGRIKVGGAPGLVQATVDAVWAVTDNGVDRIDPTTDGVVTTISMKKPEYLISDGTSVWASLCDSNEFVRIDAATNTIVDRPTVPDGPSGAVVIDGEVWVTSHRGAAVLHFDAVPITTRLPGPSTRRRRSPKSPPRSRANSRSPTAPYASPWPAGQGHDAVIDAAADVLSFISDRYEHRPAASPSDQARSKRSRFMTLSHAATKSRTNFCSASLQP